MQPIRLLLFSWRLYLLRWYQFHPLSLLIVISLHSPPLSAGWMSWSHIGRALVEQQRCCTAVCPRAPTIHTYFVSNINRSISVSESVLHHGAWNCYPPTGPIMTAPAMALILNTVYTPMPTLAAFYIPYFTVEVPMSNNHPPPIFGEKSCVELIALEVAPTVNYWLIDRTVAQKSKKRVLEIQVWWCFVTTVLFTVTWGSHRSPSSLCERSRSECEHLHSVCERSRSECKCRVRSANAHVRSANAKFGLWIPTLALRTLTFGVQTPSSVSDRRVCKL